MELRKDSGDGGGFLFPGKPWAGWWCPGGDAVSHGCCLSLRKGQPSSGAGLEVDLSRGEQGEGLERVGAEVHTQPGLVCSRESRLVLRVLQTGQPQSSRGAEWGGHQLPPAEVLGPRGLVRGLWG